MPEKSSDKIIGFILLIIGIMTIVATVVYAFVVLTGKSKPPQVLNIEAPTITLPAQGGFINTDSLQGTGIPSQVLESLKSNQTQQNTGIKILKDEDFSKILNLFIFYLLVMFISSTGAKIASIGVQMIKDIKVQAKTQDKNPSPV